MLIPRWQADLGGLDRRTARTDHRSFRRSRGDRHSISP